MNSQQLYDQPSNRPRQLRVPFKTIDCQGLVALPDAVSGWLRRRTVFKFKKWTKKFTVLYRGHLYSYKNETSGKQTSLFSLKGYTSVEREFELEEKEQLWVIKIIPAAGTPYKSKHFALPTEKDLRIWADRFINEIHLANSEEYVAMYMDSEMTQLSSCRNESEFGVYNTIDECIEREDRRLLSCAGFVSTKSLPDLYPTTMMTPLNDCSSSSSKIYEGKRACPAPPLPPRPKATKESQQRNRSPETENDVHDYVQFNLQGDDTSDDDEKYYNIDSGYAIMKEVQDPLTAGYEVMSNVQEGYSSLCNYSSGELRKKYDTLHLSDIYTDGASQSTTIQRKERKESVYFNIRNVSRKSSMLNTSEHLIPPELLEKNQNAVDIYKECLKLGTEKRNKVRIIVVGPKKSGKTCLVRRLLKKGIADVNSTNGVEIHISKCKAKLGDRNWICKEESSVEEDVNSRLLKSIIDTYKVIEDSKRSNTGEDNKNKEDDDDPFSEDGPSSIENDKWEPTYDTVGIACTRGSQSSEYESISEDLHDLYEILKAPIDEDDFAPIDFWDFAGDKEYYNTHKAFLSKDAIYIVTFDVSKTTQDVSVEESRYDLKFWLETIRCYGTDHSIDEDTPHKDPSVFIVGTHKDKYKGSLHQCKNELISEVKKAVENEETRRHVRNYYLVSNTDDTDDDFEKMRKQLLITAQATTSWNERRPVRWIYLEKSLLEEINSGQFILSKAEILEIAANTNQPITDPDEVEAFLIYHHGIGTYTYFKELPDYVVLFPQWLANAFRCIVFADTFQVEISIINEWNQFRTTGRLSENLLDHLFSCQSSEIKEHRDHILAVMEKFDIIVRPKIKLESNEVVRESNYFVPCMIRTKDLDEVTVLFKFKSKSAWLCLEFQFLPPPLTTSLLVAYSRELAVVSNVNSTGDNEPVFYSNFALFYLKDAEDEMLLIAAHKNIIQVQIWKWGHIKRSYIAIRKELDAFLHRLGRVFEMKLCYKTKLKCSDSSFACCVGMEDIEQFEEKNQYFCKKHCEFHFTAEMAADWIGIISEKNLSKEQINASRISIITLGMLTDALYDRLAVDCTPLRLRTNCDITYLYAELRRQNRHIPTKGFWGGCLKDIQETDKKIGDDIERVRLIRNEIQHLSSFTIDNSRFKELCRLVRNVAKRMGICNNKGSHYSNGVKDVLQLDISHSLLEKQEKGIKHEYPRIKMKKTSQKAKIGAGCTLECEFTTSPPLDAVVIWSKGKENKCQTTLNKTNFSSSKYDGSTLEFPSLNIFNVDMSDEGYYTCKIQYPEESAEYDDTNLTWPITFLHVLNK